MVEFVDPLNRPTFEYNSTRLKQNKLKFWIYSFFSLLLVILLTYRIIASLILIIDLRGISLISNILILLIEAFLGYYSIIYLMHFGRMYLANTQPFDNQVIDKLEDELNYPLVSILMPIYREPESIVTDSLKAAKNMNYPSDKYEVVLFEDGVQNDSIKQLCTNLDVKYLTRDNRRGFKAGAVNDALPKLKGDFVLFMDADHILQPDVILNCLKNWRKDTIAVQTRIDFVNIDTFFTLLSSYLQTQFFSLFQRARRNTGSAIFAGGACLFDRKLLINNGGMNELTIADDTDTSIILISRGFRIEYIDIIGAWALVPWDPLHLMRQVWRWLTGITKGFKARFTTIIKSKSPLYVKIDLISLGIFPTIAVIGWLLGFVVAALIYSGDEIVRVDNLFGYSEFNFLILFVAACPVFAGIAVLFIDNEFLEYTKRSKIQKLTSITGFYLMVFAAQPMLIGAVTKGLFNFKVSFNRTPKVTKAQDSGLKQLKNQYLLYTTFIFMLGLWLVFVGLSIPFWDARAITTLFTAYSGMVPLIISLLWYSRLDEYLKEVGEITALQIINSNNNLR